MGATPFRHIDFANHETITKEKLDQLESNVQWIVDNTPITLQVNDSGQAAISDLIIVGGMVRIPFSYGWGWTRVYFNGAFESSTRPIVTNSVISEVLKQPWVGVSGIDDAIFPDSRGFDIGVQSLEDLTYAGSVVVQWMAIGQRSADYDSF